MPTNTVENPTSYSTSYTDEVYTDQVEEVNYSNAITIESIGLYEPLNFGDESSLNKGIWHKFSERSNPVIGGNMIITGHRFNFGFTPEQITRKSPLFHINEVNVGDSMIITWEGKEYRYRITDQFIELKNYFDVN